CALQRMPHEIRTVYAVFQAGAAEVQRPYDWHAVRQHQVEPGNDPGEVGVVPRLADDVGIGGADRRGPPFTGERLDSLERRSVGGTGHWGSQEPDGFQ